MQLRMENAIAILSMDKNLPIGKIALTALLLAAFLFVQTFF